MHVEAEQKNTNDTRHNNARQEKTDRSWFYVASGCRPTGDDDSFALTQPGPLERYPGYIYIWQIERDDRQKKRKS